jgi:glycosyltransferase involved in cell wall biosynthesis
VIGLKGRLRFMEVKGLKIDLCMWALNGAKTLKPVLERINRVIPESVVGQRLIVDDGSTDSTVDIAKACGWTVICNEGKGISDGANTALKNVETEWFVSFEQDLLLASDWWNSIQHYSRVVNVGAASGVRYSSQPESLFKLQKYVYKKYIGDGELPAWLRHRKPSSFTLGKTLDNTLWRKDAVLKAGGFPKLACNAGIDTVLAYKLFKAGFDWVVDYTVSSVHLRLGGFKQELLHEYGYAKSLNETWQALKGFGVPAPSSVLGVASRLVYSPFTGVFLSLKTGDPNLAWMHPLMRLNYLRGALAK